MRASISRHPDLRSPVAAPLIPTPREEQEPEEERGSPMAHFTAFERISPTTEPRTSVLCLPMQALPPFAAFWRPSNVSSALAGAERAPASSSSQS